MAFTHPIFYAIYFPLAVAIFFMLKAWQIRLVPNHMGCLWALWSSSTRGLFLIALAIVTSPIYIFVPYLALRETGALIDNVYLHGTECE